MALARTKQTLREEARRSPAPRAGESQRVCEQAIAWLGKQESVPTLVWMAMAGELDPGPVVEALPEREWLTTRTPASGPLTVHSYHSPLEQHRFGFCQPESGAEEVAPERIGLALVPGLLFDLEGGRLGRGKGYYDRLLAHLPARTPRVGVTLQRWLVRRVPQVPHDIVMTHLLTEQGVVAFRRA